MRIFLFVLVLFLLLNLVGCTSTQKGMTVGALGGGVAGGAIGYFGQDEKAEDAAIGAAIGAVTGAIAGGIIGYFAGE